MTTADIAERLHARQVRSGEWRARCPHHCGKSATSLSIREASDGGILLHCFSGCNSSDVLAAIGLRWRDVLTAPKEPRREDSLDSQTRAAVARAQESLRHHPAHGTFGGEEVRVIVTLSEHTAEAIVHALAAAAQGELVQVAFLEEPRSHSEKSAA